MVKQNCLGSSGQSTRVLLAALSVLAASACGDDGASAPNTPIEAGVEAGAEAGLQDAETPDASAPVEPDVGAPPIGSDATSSEPDVGAPPNGSAVPDATVDGVVDGSAHTDAGHEPSDATPGAPEAGNLPPDTSVELDAALAADGASDGEVAWVDSGLLDSGWVDSGLLDSGSLFADGGTPHAVIGAAGGTLVGYYGAQLVIPAGALTDATDISLERESEGAPSFEVSDVNFAGAMYALLPHGTQFSAPVTVRIPFNPNQIPDGATPEIFKAEDGGTFEAIPSTVDGNFVIAEVDDFSWVIAGFTAARPRLVYAVNFGGNARQVAGFPIDRVTGNLKPAASTQPVGQQPTSVALHPSGRFLFVAHDAGSTTLNGITPDSVAVYPISSTTGKLGPLLGGASVAVGASGSDTQLVLHPSGKFLYVVQDQGLTAGEIVRFNIRSTDGALSAATSVLTGPNVTPRAFAFSPQGDFAYVTSEYTPGGTGLNYQLVTYPVDAAGAFGAAVSNFAIGSDTPSAVVVDPAGQFAYVATRNDTITQFQFTSGLPLANGSRSVTGKPHSLAADPLGKFMYLGRVEPYTSLNLFGYTMDVTGSLTQTGQGLAGCSQGACAFPTVAVAEPQGDFLYALNGTGEMTSFAVNRNSGALTQGTSLTGFVTRVGTPRLPWLFAAGGQNPNWRPRCTTGCAFTGSSSSNPNPPQPAAPTSALLTVTRGAWGGHVTSSPAGIDYGDALGQHHFSFEFGVGQGVTLSISPAGAPVQGYDVEWTGACQGTGPTTHVTVTGDTQCHVELIPVSVR